jgi:hypothetical protein
MRSRGRQVLQLGIMVHSFIIGLTLSVTAGADFSEPASAARAGLC